MSAKHPIIAVTGSSGAGTTATRDVFQTIFEKLDVVPAMLDGDSFHRYDRQAMDATIRKEREQGRNMSYFGPKANDFSRLESVFRQYSEEGQAQKRRYLHTFDEAAPYNQMPGTFTAWEALPENTDLLFYEGLHGGIETPEHNVASYVDLLIGVVPIVNLEWIQEMVRDTRERGHSLEMVTETITRSLDDYVNYIVPQFSKTHINFQRVPTIDTSNPFTARVVPSLDESLMVARFQGIEKVDFPYLLQMIDGSYMSAASTLVLPGSKIKLGMELILLPVIRQLLGTGKL